MNDVLITDPPYSSRIADQFRRVSEAAAAHKRRLVQLDALGARAGDYAKRIARETVRDFDNATDHAQVLIFAGAGDHVEATAACMKLPARPTAVGVGGRLAIATSVGHDATAAYNRCMESIELRTPPSEWTNVPPDALFEPRDGGVP